MKSITADKAALRRQVRAYGRALSPEARRASDDALLSRFLSLPQVAAADTLLLYHGMGAEPDTARLIPPLLELGKRLALPRCLPERRLEARWPSSPVWRLTAPGGASARAAVIMPAGCPASAGYGSLCAAGPCSLTRCPAKRTTRLSTWW